MLLGAIIKANIEIFSKNKKLISKTTNGFEGFFGSPGSVPDGFRGILRRLRSAGGFSWAFWSVLGRSWVVLEASWRRLKPILGGPEAILMVKITTRRHQDRARHPQDDPGQPQRRRQRPGTDPVPEPAVAGELHGGGRGEVFFLH